MAGILSVVVLPVLMGEAASAPADTRVPLSARLGSDSGILRLFAVLAGISVIASVVSSLSADGVDLYDFASSVLGGLKRGGHSVVLSTHIMQEVAALCDRIVIIAKGRVAADGTAAELLARSGCDSLEDAFVKLIGSEEGLLA